MKFGWPPLGKTTGKSRATLYLVFHQRETGDVWCLPPVWNLRAVIWFHFAISSLVLLPSPVILSVVSFSACWPFLLNFFQKILQYFLLREAFSYGSCLAVRRRQLVGGMCSMLPYDTGICCYAFISYFRIFYCFCPFLFYTFFSNLVLINRRNGPRYQRVLALCAFSTGVIPKGLILRKFCVRCLCMLCFM